MNNNNIPTEGMISKHIDAIKGGTPGTPEFDNAVTAIESIRGEHREPNNLDSLREFSLKEIDLAFNPSQLTLEEFESLPYEEKLRIYRILSIYYEIPNPQKIITPMDLDEKYHTYTSAYRIERLTDEDLKALLEIEHTEDDEESTEGFQRLSELEKFIGIQKNEFAHRNTESLQNVIGLEYDKFIDQCMNSSKIKKTEEECSNFYYKVFDKLLGFIQEDFETLDENLKYIYFRSYEKALPLEYVLSVTGETDVFDEVLFELNPIEYQKVLTALEDIRKMDKTRSQYSSWFDYFKRSMNTKYSKNEMLE